MQHVGLRLMDVDDFLRHAAFSDSTMQILGQKGWGVKATWTTGLALRSCHYIPPPLPYASHVRTAPGAIALGQPMICWSLPGSDWQ